jgi:hypothetical protein
VGDASHAHSRSVAIWTIPSPPCAGNADAESAAETPHFAVEAGATGEAMVLLVRPPHAIARAREELSRKKSGLRPCLTGSTACTPLASCGG